MSQNPLYFYGLLEMLLVLLALAGYWYWHLYKIRKRLDTAWQAFEEIVEYQRRNLAHSGNNALVNEASCYLDVLEKLAADEPPGSTENWQALWKALVRPATKIEEKAPVGDTGHSGPEWRDMDTMLEQQSEQIANLTSYKTHIESLLRGKFDHIQQSNQELMSSVRHLMGGQTDVRGLLDIIARMEENSENLQAMVGEMEKAKRLAEPQLEALTRDNQRLRAETGRSRTQIRDLTEQKQLCEAKIAELAKKIDQCMQTYNLLQRRYESLQHDYLQLLK